MGGLFSKPKKAPMPKPPSPVPTPVDADEEFFQKERDRRRQRLSATGRAGTILTGAEPLGGKATILGRSV